MVHLQDVIFSEDLIFAQKILFMCFVGAKKEAFIR